MLWTIAAAAFVVNSAVVHLGSMLRSSEPLGSPNSLQLIEWNRGPNRIFGSVSTELDVEVSTAMLGTLVPLIVCCTGLVVL